MRITFFTDSSVSSGGFRATYSSDREAGDIIFLASDWKIKNSHGRIHSHSHVILAISYYIVVSEKLGCNGYPAFMIRLIPVLAIHLQCFHGALDSCTISWIGQYIFNVFINLYDFFLKFCQHIFNVFHPIPFNISL